MVNVIYGLMRSDLLRRTRLMGTFVGADEVLVLELSLYGRFIEIPTSRFYRRIHEKAFSQMKSLQEKQAFFDPASTGRFFLYVWQHYYEYLKGILHAPLPVTTKVKTIGVLCRSAIGMRTILLKELLSGTQRIVRRRLSLQ